MVRNVYALSVGNVKKVVPTVDDALISVMDPKRDKDRPDLTKWSHSLKLTFADYANSNITNVTLFTEDMAKEIKTFVDELPATVHNLYVHCHAGKSRSPAIAICLYQYFGYGNLKIQVDDFIFPNKLVVKTLNNVLLNTSTEPTKEVEANPLPDISCRSLL